MAKTRAPATLLTPEERRAASQMPVWVVWWELPDRSWEALCRSEQEAQAESKRRNDDHVVRTWGRCGISEPQMLLEWFERQVAAAGTADDHLAALRELLRRAAEDEPGAVIVRTW